MVTLARLVQAPKARTPMLVTLLGMVTLVNLEHPSKAHSPMLVTLPGMENEEPAFPRGYRTKAVLFLL